MLSILPKIGIHRAVTWIVYLIMFIVVIMAILFLFIRKVMIQYNNMEIQNKVLQRDLELNSILKHEYIQKLICPHDLLTFNDEHIYTVDKCSMCNKQCKKECWTQYFIDKLKQEKETDKENLLKKE